MGNSTFKKMKFKTNNLDLGKNIKVLSEVFKDDPLVVITEDNYSMYFRMYEDSKRCRVCKGLSTCKNTSRGYRTEVFIRNGIPYEKLVICNYLADEQTKLNKNNLIKTMYMPKKVLESDLEDFRLDSPERKAAYRAAVNFITNFQKGSENKGICFYGSFASGKTYLLGAMAKELSKRDISSFLIYFPDLIVDLKGSFSDSARYTRIMNMLKTIDVLMIDDLGAENLTTWVRDEILGPIINYRVMEGLPILISTNLPYGQPLLNHLSNVKNDSDKLKGMRIYQRISNNVDAVKFPNKPYIKE